VEIDGGGGGADWVTTVRRRAAGARGVCGGRARDSINANTILLRGLAEEQEERGGIYRGAWLAREARV
jgi:hypothetical protein